MYDALTENNFDIQIGCFIQFYIICEFLKTKAYEKAEMLYKHGLEKENLQFYE